MDFQGCTQEQRPIDNHCQWKSENENNLNEVVACRPCVRGRLAGTMQLSWGARSSRPLPSASRRRAGHNHLVTPFSEWILPARLFGETPNRATETVALPFSDCMVPALPQPRCGWRC